MKTRLQFDASPGTPAYIDDSEQTDNDNDPLIYRDIDIVKAGNVEKAHKGLITTVDVFDVEICSLNKLYRASISDGEKRSNKVVFHADLNEQVEAELVGDGRVSTIKLESVDILKDVIVGILRYVKLGDGPEHVDAEYVGDSFYKTLKPRGCFTPSRMKRNQLFK